MMYRVSFSWPSFWNLIPSSVSFPSTVFGTDFKQPIVILRRLQLRQAVLDDVGGANDRQEYLDSSEIFLLRALAISAIDADCWSRLAACFRVCSAMSFSVA